VVEFYRARLKENWPSRLRRRVLNFEVDGKRRFVMQGRTQHAYVWQRGRFDGDVEFWRSRLGSTCRLDPVADGTAIRFFLNTTEEFSAFWRAYREDMSGKVFHHEPPADDADIEEEEGETNK
jgi:hypothetical protein